jgi:hypothetical protein
MHSIVKVPSATLQQTERRYNTLQKQVHTALSDGDYTIAMNRGSHASTLQDTLERWSWQEA